MNEMTTYARTLPQRVINKVHQLGVHNDCFMNGQQDAKLSCESCQKTIFTAIDFCYPGVPKADIVLHVVQELLDEAEEDR